MADSQAGDGYGYIGNTGPCRRSYLATYIRTCYVQYPHRNDIKVGAMSEIWGKPTSLSQTASIPAPNLPTTCNVSFELEWFSSSLSRTI